MTGLINAEFLLIALVVLQAMTGGAVALVGFGIFRLEAGLRRLEPIVIPPKPTGNPSIRLYDSAAYFVEWLQVHSNHGEKTINELWLLYNKYCAMRDIPAAEMHSRTMLSNRLTQLVGPSKTHSEASGKKRQRTQVYTIPCPVEDYQLADLPFTEFPSKSVVNFRQAA